MILALNNAVKLEKDKNSQFVSRVIDLREEIAQSNREVYYLKEELNSMNASFEAIFKKYNLQNKKISDLNQKLNEVAYVIGSKSELLDNGVLTKSGGLIGIGNTRKLNSDLNTDYFTYVSKYKFQNIPLGYKTVRLMTAHPTSSYRLSTSNEITDSLIILDKSSKEKIEKSIKNIPNIKVTDINHFSAFDIVKFKKVVFTESSVKELEKRYS